MEKETEKSTDHPKSQDVKTSKHATRYFFVGLSVTLFNYILYTLLANIFFDTRIDKMTDNDPNGLIWLASLISTAITTIVAYIAHSKITWKERNVTKHSVIRFFIWNAILTFVIAPGFTQFFSLLTPLYEFAYNIIEAMHIPFSYEFTLTTGAFVLTSAVIMIMNFLFYDKFVFGKTKPTPKESKD